MNRTATVVRLTIDDYDDIVNLWIDTGLPYKPHGRDGRQMIETEMQRDGVAYFGIHDDDMRLIAVGIANYDGRRGWINRVAVAPAYRGRRLARQVIDACEEFLKAQGAIVIAALIEEINEPSMNCFRHCGYLPMREIVYWSKRDSDKS